MTPKDDVERQVGDYYSEKIRLHGATARGVDWNSEEGQTLRFSELMKVANNEKNFSINEIGCGYGALLDYLIAQNLKTCYHGVDLSDEMVAAARARRPHNENISFATGSRPEKPRDYCVASGIFNVRLKIPDARWLAGILDTLDVMNEMSTRGFAFNALTSYSDKEKMRDYLYYADPLKIFDHCKRRYSRHVSLLHDYGLYEFTILVTRQPRL